MKKIIISLILVFGVMFGSNVFGEENANKITRVSFYNSDIKSHFLGEKSEFIGLYMEPYYISQLHYKIEILKGKEFVEVIHTEGFRDYLKLKRITNSKYVGINEISIKVTNKYDKEGYIYNGRIEIVQPILLVSGELGPKGGKIQNQWKDIAISVKPNILKKTYKIDYVGGGRMINIISTPKMSDYEMSELNLNQPNREILKHNYLNYPKKDTYYTYKNVEEPDFRKLINEQKKKENRNLSIKEKTSVAWNYFKEIDKYSGDNIDIGKIKLYLDKSEKVIIDLNKGLTDEEKEIHTKKILYKIEDVRKQIKKYEDNLNVENNKIEKVVLKGEKEGIIQLPLYGKKQIVIFIKKKNNNFIGKGFSIKVINKPNFLENKVINGINYFEVNYNKINLNDIKYNLTYEILIDGKSTGFIKKNIIEIIKPNILFIGETSSEGGILMNDWEDAYTKIDKGYLDKKYKIASLYYENIQGERTYYTVTNPQLDKLLHVKFPPNISHNNKTDLNKIKEPLNNWTTINIKKVEGNNNVIIGKITNKEIEKYNTCVSDKQKSYLYKFNCFKEYMGFNKKDIVNNTEEQSLKTKFIKQLIISKIKLKNTKFGKLIPKFEKLVPKISDKKLLEIDKKIGSFSEKIRNNEKYKDILNYLEAEVKLEVIKRELKQ